MKFHQLLRLASVVLFLSASFCGCSQQDTSETSENEKGKPKTSSLKNLKLHRPKSLQLAVKRLKELHEAILSEAVLKSKTLRVVEILHGEGTPSEHSHFYLEEKFKSGAHKEDAHHEGVTESQKTHELEITVAKEYADIARWLPSLAAATDLSEDAWTKVETISDELTSAISDSLKKSSLPEKEMREAYRKSIDKTAPLIADLEKLVSELGDK